MRNLVFAILTVSMAATVWAQTAPPAADATPADARAARQKASPDNVKKATAGTAKGYTGAAGEAANKAAATKDMPKAAPDNTAKRNAVESATSGTAKGYTQSAGEAATNAANDKTPRTKAPKPQAGTPELKKVVP
jgi:hypothetical protein